MPVDPGSSRPVCMRRATRMLSATGGRPAGADGKPRDRSGEDEESRRTERLRDQINHARTFSFREAPGDPRGPAFHLSKALLNSQNKQLLARSLIRETVVT